MSQFNSRRLKSNDPLRHAGLVAVCAGGLSLFSCRAGRNFYVLEEIRVPALQSLQTVDALPEGRGDCFEHNGEKVCQQYPLRPAKKAVFRFLAIAPSTTLPMTLRLTKLQRAKLPQVLSQDSDCATIQMAAAKIRSTEVALASLGLQDAQWTRQLKQETPMHIEEHSISFTAPAAQTLLNEGLAEGWLPLFTLEYEASIQGSSFRTDRGAFTFTVVPEPQAGGNTDGNTGGATDTARCLSRAFSGGGTAQSNTAPYIKSITPAAASKVSGSKTDLLMTLSDADPDTDAKRRVQWYVSRGELDNQRDATTSLTFSGTEPLTALGIVRDLQGGLDFAWTTFSGN
ncbi:MAG: hypothetical protein EBR09_14910 [Proteobacteria bacterium]|nr:hypothetical protein [Pseudomonadota bacterium]